ncbi:MAG: alanyl-tRNA editing protein [Alphaproteobacteria bacterium]|nr:alanyl-tRNA editing protein [Alphaproteobacteria bacterium]
MSEELFRTDAYLQSNEAVVTASGPDGIELDRTVFYPMGGGQPGDSGSLRRADGGSVAIADTRKGAAPEQILHVPAAGQALPAVGERVTAQLDWARRHRLMRMHTCLHLLCAVVPAGVTGGQVGEARSRLDFDVGELALDKSEIERKLNALISANHPAVPRWISDAELAAQPQLVRTMSVKPPSGHGRVRLLEIGAGAGPNGAVDLQPCGGTHVRATGEIGPVVVEKIENKGKRNRRMIVALAAP